MDSKNIFVIITANRYPRGDAGAVRLHAFAKVLISLQYEPYVIGMGDKTDFQERIYDGVRYISLRYAENNIWGRMLGRALYYENLKKQISFFSIQTVKGILIDSGSIKVFKYIENYSIKNAIPLYYDAVEWYSASEFSNGERNIAFKNNNYLNTKLISSSYKVIAISTYLERHFLSRKIMSIRIPVIMDVKQIKCEKNFDGNIIKIVYAGTIGRKDHISELIDAICCLEEDEIKKIQFCIIGITKEDYEKRYGKIKEGIIDNSILFMGRVSRDVVLEQLKNATVSFLLRPDADRYSKAGFPTKVVEALAAGTPILGNYTSDLALYLKDGVNSIEINACNVECCVESLRKMLSYSKEDFIFMSEAARRTAEEYFDWRLYVEVLRDFFSK